jgi:hypothetical protein
MATIKTLSFTAQEERNISLHQDVSMRDIQASLRIIRVEHTVLGTETGTDDIELIFPNLEGYVLPHLSRVTNTGAGDVDVDITLEKVDTAGTVTALTAAAAVDNDSVAFARPSGGVVPKLEATDYLRAALTVTAMTAGDKLLFEIAIYTPYGE